MTSRLLLVLLLVLAAARPAFADRDADKAAEHFSLAEAAEKRGDWETAILEYKRAYALKPHPSVLYNIAVDYEKLGDFTESADYYQRYLDSAGDAADDREDVEEKITELRAKARPRPHAGAGTGHLVVRANIDGAAVSIDGVFAGKTPLDLEVPAGPHRVVVTAPGHEPASRDVDVPSGGSEEIREFLADTPGGGGDGGGDAGKRVRWGFGFIVGTGVTTSNVVRGGLALGVRNASERFELDFYFGRLGQNDNGVGVDGRLFLSTAAFRPYARVAATLGNSTFGATDYRTFGAEAGGGLLYSMNYGAQVAPQNPGTRMLAIEYYLEANARFTAGGVADMDGVTIEPEQKTQRFLLAIDFAIMIRF